MTSIKLLNSPQYMILQMTPGLLLTENSLKKLNKHINRDLKLVIQWIRANKLSTGKTKIVIFKSRNTKITKHLNFRISGQKIVPVDSVKYLGLTLQSDFR